MNVVPNKSLRKKRNPLHDELTLNDFVEPIRTAKSATQCSKIKHDKGEKLESVRKCTSINEADAMIFEFLKKVKNFQDRAWKKNPIKANSKRRLVFGLREVHKHLTLEAVSCVILARDIESDKMNVVDELSGMCVTQAVNILWVSSRRDMGKLLKKWPFVSAVAVLDYSGAEDEYNKMQKITDPDRITN